MKRPAKGHANSFDITKITTYESGVVQAAAFRNMGRKITELLKRHNITMMQWFVVGTIYSAGTGGMRLTDLAKKVNTGLPFLTNMVNLLETKGYVKRVNNQDDSRSKFVVINPNFSPRCEVIENDLRQGLRNALYKSIDPEELAIYAKVLYQLAAVE